MPPVKKLVDFGVKAALMVAVGLLVINTIRNRIPGADALYRPIASGL